VLLEELHAMRDGQKQLDRERPRHLDQRAEATREVAGYLRRAMSLAPR